VTNREQANREVADAIRESYCSRSDVLMMLAKRKYNGTLPKTKKGVAIAAKIHPQTVANRLRANEEIRKLFPGLVSEVTAANAAGEEKILRDKDGKFVKKFRGMSLKEFETIEEGSIEDFILSSQGAISVGGHPGWIILGAYPRHRVTLHIKKINGGKTIITKIDVFNDDGNQIDTIKPCILLDKDKKSANCFLRIEPVPFEKIEEGTIENFELTSIGSINIGGHKGWMSFTNYPNHKVSLELKKIKGGNTIITRVRIYEDDGQMLEDITTNIVLDKDGKSLNCFINMPSQEFEKLDEVTVTDFKLDISGNLSIGGHVRWIKLSSYPNHTVSFDLVKIGGGKTVIKAIRVYDKKGKKIDEIKPCILLDKDGKSLDCFLNMEEEEFEKIDKATVVNFDLNSRGYLSIGGHQHWFFLSSYPKHAVSFDMAKIEDGKTVITEIRIYNKAGTRIIRKIRPYQFLDADGRSFDCFISRFGYLPPRLKPQQNGTIKGYVLNADGIIGISNNEYYHIFEYGDYENRKVDIIVKDGKKGFVIYDSEGQRVEKIIPVGELQPHQYVNGIVLESRFRISSLYDEISNMPIGKWYDALISVDWITEKKGAEMISMFNNLIDILSLDDKELALRIFLILDRNAVRRTQLNGLIKTKDSLVSQIGNGDLTTKQKRDILIREYLLLLLREISDRTGPVRVRVSKDGTR